MPLRDLNPVDSAAELLTQWRRDARPNLQALVREFLEVFKTELSDPLITMTTYRRLDTAVGVWLDFLGELLGLPRPSLPETSARFGFAGGDGVGFNQAPFASINPVFRLRRAAGDATYRALLRARGLMLRTGTSIDELQAVTDLLLGADVATWATGASPMTVIVEIETGGADEDLLDLAFETRAIEVGVGEAWSKVAPPYEMAITIPAARLTTDSGTTKQWNFTSANAIQLDAEFQPGSQERWLRRVIAVNNISGVDIQVRLLIGSDATESAFGTGDDLPTDWETRADAVTWAQGSTSIVTPGPNNSGNAAQDATDPYLWSPAQALQDELDQFFFTDLDTSADWTLTLRVTP